MLLTVIPLAVFLEVESLPASRTFTAVTTCNNNTQESYKNGQNVHKIQWRKIVCFLIRYEPYLLRLEYIYTYIFS